MALTTLSLMFRSAATAPVIAQSTTDTSTARCTPIKKYSANYAAVCTAFAPAIVSVAGQILHPEFLRLQSVWADKQTHHDYALIGAEEEIGSEAFTWSRACTFRFNKNSIGKAVVYLAIAYATATRLHLSVHSTAPPSRCQPGQPISSAECLMHGAAQASHRAAPRPTLPRPAVSVDVGAPSVAPAAHATRAGASGEADVNADGTHARMLTLQLGMPMYTRAL